MAKLTGNIGFIGSIGNMSAYKMKGVDQIILRGKGGANKSRIKQHPNFELVRRNNAEFGACSRAGTSIRNAIYPLRQLADFNISGHLNAIAKIILKKDPVNDLGQRAIRFSAHHQLLDGFSLNRELLFNTVIRHPVSCSIFRDTGTANIELPGLLPGTNFYPPYEHSLYRFTIALGEVPDWVYIKDGYKPEHSIAHGVAYMQTEWSSTKQVNTVQSIDLQLANFKGLKDGSSLVVSIGIEFGRPLSNTIVEPVKHAGCAVILCTA